MAKFYFKPATNELISTGDEELPSAVRPDTVAEMTADQFSIAHKAPRKCTHYVKSWTFLFDPLFNGAKTHDLRVLDRDYKVGDVLVLQQYDWGAKQYTGKECVAEVTYITSAQHTPCAFSPSALNPSYGILSVRKVA